MVNTRFIYSWHLSIWSDHSWESRKTWGLPKADWAGGYMYSTMHSIFNISTQNIMKAVFDHHQLQISPSPITILYFIHIFNHHFHQRTELSLSLGLYHCTQQLHHHHHHHLQTVQWWRLNWANESEFFSRVASFNFYNQFCPKADPPSLRGIKVLPLCHQN